MDRQPTLIGTGMYPLPRAARLVGAEVRSVRRWLKGYAWKQGDDRKLSCPLWTLEHAHDEEFGDVIRATIDVARETLGDYPLHSKRFVTDGKKIFLEAVERAGEDPKLLDVRRQQFAMDAVIRPSLLEGIEYGADATALRWFPVPKKRLVVLNPQVQFGEPILAEGRAPTDTLAAAHQAEGQDVERVARLYRVAHQEVRAAVAYEQQIAA